MSIEKNKEVVRRFIEEVYNNCDFSHLEDFISEDWILHTAAGAEIRGIEAEKKYVVQGRSPFSEYHVAIEDMVAEGDKVAVRATRLGKQTEQFRNISPTGKIVNVARYTIYRLENGKLVEGWTLDDRLGQFQQLGVIPPVEELGK